MDFMWNLYYPNLGLKHYFLLKMDEHILGRFERKIVHKIFDPVCVHGIWRRIFYNSDIDSAKKLRIGRLRWSRPCKLDQKYE